MRKIQKGSRVRLTWRVTKVWPDGRVSMRFRSLDDPITVRQEQQNYSLEALAKRDAMADPFGSGGGAVPAAPAPAPSEAKTANDNPEQERAQIASFEKDLREALNA